MPLTSLLTQTCLHRQSSIDHMRLPARRQLCCEVPSAWKAALSMHVRERAPLWTRFHHGLHVGARRDSVGNALFAHLREALEHLAELPLPAVELRHRALQQTHVHV